MSVATATTMPALMSRLRKAILETGAHQGIISDGMQMLKMRTRNIIRTAIENIPKDAIA